jgi:hypothetical protein
MNQERWTAEQCAAHAGITTSTWRDYVADHRAPAPLPGYDPHTGRKTWDPATVRAWHAQRPGQGTRTDLTYLPSPDGQPVFINPTTITTATLLRDLTGAAGATIPKSALRQRWAQQFADDNHTPPLPQPGRDTTNTPTTRQINKALNNLNRLGAIQHDRRHITITDHAILTNIATLNTCREKQHPHCSASRRSEQRLPYRRPQNRDHR